MTFWNWIHDHFIVEQVIKKLNYSNIRKNKTFFLLVFFTNTFY